MPHHLLIMLPPSPYQKLANCVWLSRIIGKARLIARGQLPEEFVSRFCHPGGVDGQFLKHFQFNREQILATGRMNDEEVEAWFLAEPSVTAETIAQWNHTAINLGRPGYPMEDRLQIGLTTIYQHLAGQGFETVFEVLCADDESI